jgi:putative transposase
VKHAYIAQQPRGALSKRLMCECLGLSRSGYYAAQRRPPSARAQQDAQLRTAIRVAHARSQRRYGRPKLHFELREAGWTCGHNRLARLMRLDGVRAKRPRAFRVTTRSDHAHPVAANILARAFDPAGYRERDTAWAADLTFIPTGEGWLYLAVVLDLASRRVIGWHAAVRPDQQLTLTALRRAIALRQPRPGVLHHSDRGVQYAVGGYRRVLDDHGFRCSMSRPGNCWDNAVVESFFATLKTELVHDAHWRTRSEAVTALRQFIDVWYNQQRRHASLGFCSPIQYERRLAQLRSA